MAKYTGHHAVTVHNTVELAAAGLEALVDAVDVTRHNVMGGIERIEGNKYAAWLVYTDEA